MKLREPRAHPCEAYATKKIVDIDLLFYSLDQTRAITPQTSVRLSIFRIIFPKGRSTSADERRLLVTWYTELGIILVNESGQYCIDKWHSFFFYKWNCPFDSSRSSIDRSSREKCNLIFFGIPSDLYGVFHFQVSRFSWKRCSFLALSSHFQLSVSPGHESWINSPSHLLKRASYAYTYIFVNGSRHEKELCKNRAMERHARVWTELTRETIQQKGWSFAYGHAERLYTAWIRYQLTWHCIRCLNSRPNFFPSETS